MAKLGNLASRFLVAIVIAPILVFLMYQGRPEYINALVFVAAVLAMYEFFAMTLPDRTDRRASIIAGTATILTLYWSGPLLAQHSGHPGAASLGSVLTIAVAVVPIALYYLFRFGDMASVAARMAYSITGILYVGVLFTYMALIKRDFGASGADILLLVLLVAWTGDTGAYFAGRFLGKNRLYPAVSPKKTWAGAIGGVVVSTASAIGVKLLLMPELPWLDVFMLAIPGAALGQMGDLVESLFKRSVGVKDSGSLLPGHGGILDRVDAVLFIGPYVYLYLSLRTLV